MTSRHPDHGNQRVLMPESENGVAWLAVWGRDRTGAWWALVHWTRPLCRRQRPARRACIAARTAPNGLTRPASHARTTATTAGSPAVTYRPGPSLAGWEIRGGGGPSPPGCCGGLRSGRSTREREDEDDNTR